MGFKRICGLGARPVMFARVSGMSLRLNIEALDFFGDCKYAHVEWDRKKNRLYLSPGEAPDDYKLSTTEGKKQASFSIGKLIHYIRIPAGKRIELFQEGDRPYFETERI